MVDLNYKIRIIFSILSMILSVHCLEISILNFLTVFKCKTNVMFKITDGQKIYNGTNLKPINYEPLNPNSTVIVYVTDENNYEQITDLQASECRITFAQVLMNCNYELIVLGSNINGSDEWELVKRFTSDLMENIEPHRIRLISPSNFGFTGAENLNNYELLLNYLTNGFPKIERPDLHKIKKVKFYDYTHVKRPHQAEVMWPVLVKNGVYDPKSDSKLKTMLDNFQLRHPDNTVHILIVDGEKYDWILNKRGFWKQYTKLHKEMLGIGHFLCLMGCFNFDWSDMELVPQIILKHSEKPDPLNKQNKVFTIGVGMFETRFENPYPNDVRQLLPTPYENLQRFALECNGGNWSKTKYLQIWDFNAYSSPCNETITLVNGRYALQNGANKHYFSTYPIWNFAFIVIDSTAMRGRDISTINVTGPLQDLQGKGILVFVIIASNFKFDDLHIIPEWIECHRGDVHPNRITILGAGTFDTTYEYLSPLYQVSYPPSFFSNELILFRQCFV